MIKYTKSLLSKISLIFFLIFFLYDCSAEKDKSYNLWLKYNIPHKLSALEEYQELISYITLAGNSETIEILREELKRGLYGLMRKELYIHDSVISDGALVIGTPASSAVIDKSGFNIVLDTLGNEGYLIKASEINGYKAIVLAANEDIGLLYGTFHLLRIMQTQKSLKNINLASKPKIQYRLLNHWDNLNRTVERGYAGQSLWKWDELPDMIDPRYRDYAYACASTGINGTVINNVNATPEILKPEYIRKISILADIFRPFGIKLYLSINFSSPLKSMPGGNRRQGGIGNLSTSDPLDPEVRNWWKAKADEIYKYIPDFGGFLVKANSEGMPGPQDFGRTHAEGANMLAEALESHNGIVMWRAFVYEPDVDPDRAKRSYMEFVPLDGKFHPNVFVQAKNGPVDFQPREPVQPLFGSMPATPLMMELQITQEYLGHSKHLV
ncbi:MAG: alpha-glucuronidase, partial [Bacteroidales bacterium]